MMPEEHFSLKPNIAKVMADVCRGEVNYRPGPMGSPARAFSALRLDCPRN
jgi:hypothetical protein